MKDDKRTSAYRCSIGAACESRHDTGNTDMYNRLGREGRVHTPEFEARSTGK